MNSIEKLVFEVQGDRRKRNKNHRKFLEGKNYPLSIISNSKKMLEKILIFFSKLKENPKKILFLKK